jgi:hypothetical protein
MKDGGNMLGRREDRAFQSGEHSVVGTSYKLGSVGEVRRETANKRFLW